VIVSPTDDVVVVTAQSYAQDTCSVPLEAVEQSSRVPVAAEVANRTIV
jgi:hypothetical protein